MVAALDSAMASFSSASLVEACSSLKKQWMDSSDDHDDKRIYYLPFFLLKRLHNLCRLLPYFDLEKISKPTLLLNN